MAAPQIPYTGTGTLNFPPDDGKPAADRIAQVSGNFTKSAAHKLNLSGTGSHTVGFGSVGSPGAKAILVEYNNDDAQAGLQPIQLTVNGGTDDIEISPGGFFLYSSPSPVTGITGLAIAHTSDARVNIWILG